MKKSVFAVLALVFLFSCTKHPTTNPMVDITEGSKYGIQIGSSPTEVYSQLQALGQEKNFSYISVLNRGPFNSPDSIENILPYYNGIGLALNNNVTVDQVYFALGQNKVDSILTSNGQTSFSKINQWPLKVDYTNPFLPGDDLATFYTKLKTLYQDSYYSNFLIYVQDKPLAKAFDPTMANYSQWVFQFLDQSGTGVNQQQQVLLAFGTDGKLALIRVLSQNVKG